MAKHIKNVCPACGHSWYPRGHAISSECPRCHSAAPRLSYIETGGLLLKLGLLSLIAIPLFIGMCRGCMQGMAGK